MATMERKSPKCPILPEQIGDSGELTCNHSASMPFRVRPVPAIKNWSKRLASFCTVLFALCTSTDPPFLLLAEEQMVAFRDFHSLVVHQFCQSLLQANLPTNRQKNGGSSRDPRLIQLEAFFFLHAWPLPVDELKLFSRMAPGR